VCKVYIAAYDRRILPPRRATDPGSRAVMKSMYVICSENFVIFWIGDGPDMATLAAVFRLTHFYNEA
jgi:hypothetical protein